MIGWNYVLVRIRTMKKEKRNTKLSILTDIDSIKSLFVYLESLGLLFLIKKVVDALVVNLEKRDINPIDIVDLELSLLENLVDDSRN